MPVTLHDEYSMTGKQGPFAIEAASSPSSTPSVARTHRVAVVLSFFSIYVIWGSTYLAIRYAVETIPPLYTAGLRHLIAGTILLVWCLARRLRPTWAQVRASIIIGTFFFLIGHGTLHWAEQKVPSGLASLLIASEPIWVFLLTAIAARQWRLNATLLAGIFLGLGGVGLLMGRSALNSGPGVFIGSLAILLGALSWSVGVIYSRRSHLSGHPLLLSALSLLAGSFQLLLAGTVAGEYRGFSLAAWLAFSRPPRTRAFQRAEQKQKGAPLNCRTRLLTISEIVGLYIFDISTDARVVSQSMRSVQPLAVLSKAMVKFSAAEGSADAFMSIRAKSSDGPG